MRDVLLDEPRSSGAVLLNLWAALQEIAGSAAYAQGLGSLSAEAREEIDHAQAISWIRIRTSFALVDAVALAARLDAEQLYDDAVKKSVERTYRGVWKVFLRLTSPEALLTRASLMYSKSRNWGKMSAHMLNSGDAELRVVDWPHMPERQIRSLGIASATILAITGRKSEFVATATRDGAVIRITWA